MSVQLGRGPFGVPSHIQVQLGLSALCREGVSQYDIGRGRVGHSFSLKYLAHPCRGTKHANRSPHQGGRNQFPIGSVQASTFRDPLKVESEIARSAATILVNMPHEPRFQRHFLAINVAVFPACMRRYLKGVGLPAAHHHTQDASTAACKFSCFTATAI